MSEPNAGVAELGRELFRCRPKRLWSYFGLRNQGTLPPFKSLRFLNPVIAVITPVAESLILGLLPTVIVIFVLQVLMGLKPPHEPPWVRPFCFAFLAVSVPGSLWWYWIVPRKDRLVVFERDFSWVISLCRWEWFRIRGSLVLEDVARFSYRSDCFAAEPIEFGKATGDKLVRIWLELNLSRHDIAFHLKNNENMVVEKFFARFEEDDLRRFLDHLSALADPNRIDLTADETKAKDGLEAGG